MPAPPTTSANTTVSATVMSPIACGRRAVRAMRASISRSARQLTANAALVSRKMPMVAGTATRQSGMPSVARNMPMMAQNTAIWVMRGLVNAQNWPMRFEGLVRVCVVMMCFRISKLLLLL